MIGERPSSGADAGADTGEAGELARARAGDVAAFGADLCLDMPEPSPPAFST